MYLSKTSAALVIDKNGGLSMHLPLMKGGEDEVVPDNYRTIAGIGLLLSDDKYREQLMNLIEKKLEESSEKLLDS